MKISQGALPLMLGSYARNYNINLYMKGSFAYTNGKSIVIPRLHLDDKDSLEMAYGYVAHECGHIRYSDFSLLRNLDNQKVLMTLFNAIEDPRIEFLQTKDWPGLRETFNFLVDKLQSLSLNCLSKHQKNEEQDCTPLLLLFCNYYLRFKEIGQDAAKKLYHTAKKYLTPQIGLPAVNCLERLLKGTSLAENSAEVLKTAQKILDFMSTLKDISLNSPNANHDLYCEKSTNFLNILNEFDFKDKEFTPDNKQDQELIGELIKDLQNNPHRFKDMHLSLDSTENLALINYGIKEYLNQKSDNVDIDEEFGVMQAGIAKPRDNSNLLERIKVDPLLISNLRELVKGYDLWNHGFSSSGTSINIPRFAMRKSGNSLNDRIFNKKIIHRTPNTTIHLLVDSSGSMYTRCYSNHRYRYEIANEVALSLALAFEGQNHLSTEVTYFPGRNSEFETVAKPKEFISNKAAFFDQEPKGGTPMAQALMHAIYSFPQGNLKRNIVLIITDGDPDNPQAVDSLLKEAMKRNVEVYAIRIGNQTSCPTLFPVSRTIEDASELPQAVLSMLSNSLFETTCS